MTLIFYILHVQNVHIWSFAILWAQIKPHFMQFLNSFTIRSVLCVYGLPYSLMIIFIHQYCFLHAHKQRLMYHYNATSTIVVRIGFMLCVTVLLHASLCLSLCLSLPYFLNVFTTQCTLVHSAVLGSHVVRPSVCLKRC